MLRAVSEETWATERNSTTGAEQRVLYYSLRKPSTSASGQSGMSLSSMSAAAL